MKSIGMFIFGGSATMGAMAAGAKVEKILELTDDMAQCNAYHFVKNYPNIPIITPSEWEANEDYCKNLKKENYDLLYANCPCSGLSQINRNANVNSNANIHFFRLFDVLYKIEPKTFIIENAPTLIKIGYPIIQKMIDALGEKYKFTVIRDQAGNHNVAMKRMRTMLVGWRKDVFESKIPLLQMNIVPQLSLMDVIGSVNENVPNYTDFVHKKTSIDHLFPEVAQESSLLLTALKRAKELLPMLENDSMKRQIQKAYQKKTEGKNIWDKSPWRPGENKPAPSLTSVSEFLHPVEHRHLSIREYARIMGYPDDFVFYPNECKVDTIQVIAQGVPANFIKYIVSEIFESLKNKRFLLECNEDDVLVFQHHIKRKFKIFRESELKIIKELDVDKNSRKLIE